MNGPLEQVLAAFDMIMEVSDFLFTSPLEVLESFGVFPK